MSSHVYSKKLVANAVPESTKKSAKHASRLSALLLRKLTQFDKFWSNHSANRVPVNQSNVLDHVNRAHPP